MVEELLENPENIRNAGNLLAGLTMGVLSGTFEHYDEGYSANIRESLGDGLLASLAYDIVDEGITYTELADQNFMGLEDYPTVAAGYFAGNQFSKRAMNYYGESKTS